MYSQNINGLFDEVGVHLHDLEKLKVFDNGFDFCRRLLKSLFKFNTLGCKRPIFS